MIPYLILNEREQKKLTAEWCSTESRSRSTMAAMGGWGRRRHHTDSKIKMQGNRCTWHVILFLRASDVGCQFPLTSS